jgi:hypothetical protein
MAWYRDSFTFLFIRFCRLVYPIQIFGDNYNESKPDSGGNEEEIEFGKCLLPFSPEPFVFSCVV